jgi:hypothetical protein
VERKITLSASQEFEKKFVVWLRNEEVAKLKLLKVKG